MCIMCDGGSRDEALFDVHASVLHRGWALQGVVSDPTHGPSWVYSIGLSTGFGHPELVLVGDRLREGAQVLNEVGEMVRAGRRFAVGHAALLSTGPVVFGAVHDRHIEDGLVAVWVDYYGSLGPPRPNPDFLQVVVAESDPLLADPAVDVVGGPVPRPNRAERRGRPQRWR